VALLRTVFLLMFLLLALAATGLILLVDDAPGIEGSGAMTAADLQQAKAFLSNADPRRQGPGELSSLTVRAGELELLLNYLMENLYGGKSHVLLTPGKVQVQFSAGLPANLLGSHLNVTMGFAQYGQALVLENLRVGKLALPTWLADALLQWSHEELKRRSPEYIAVLQAVREYRIGPAALVLVYEWHDSLLTQISSGGRELLIGEEGQARLQSHAAHLSALTRDPSLATSRVSVSALLGPMFSFARQRAGNPVEENRAVLLLLALYVMDVDLHQLLDLPESAVGALTRHRITLSGRPDVARHFLISAGLAVSAGSGVADSVGLFKEIEDAVGGSGFSFTDLAADRSGIRFAEYAVAGPEQARAVQALLSGRLEEGVFIADFKDLPEFLEEERFLRQYGGVGSPAYNLVIEEIDARIALLPIFATRQ